MACVCLAIQDVLVPAAVYVFLFKTILLIGFEMQPKQNVPSALPSHTSAKHPWPSFFFRNNESRATSQASLANPEVCGV